MTIHHRILLGALALGALSACGGGDLVLPGEGEAAAVRIVDGDAQNGRVGAELARPVVARVTDSDGRPVADVRVRFELVDGGSDADLSPDSATTDAQGLASAALKLGTRVGEVTGRVRVPTAEGRPEIAAPFTATALSADANGIGLVSGDGQSAPVGSPLPEPLVVQVTDAFGNPIPGITVTWTALNGGDVTPASGVTDANGLAAATRTLGAAAGAQSTEASAEGLAGSPVTFTHTATAGNAARVVIVSGNGQTADAGTRLPEPLVVQVLDAEGNGVPSRAVTWIVATGGGSAEPPTTTTDGEGRASTQWTLGPNPGADTVSAVVSGIGVVKFGATATGTGPATSLTLRTQPSPNAIVGVPFGRQPVVQLRDAGGNEVRLAGVAVTAAVVAGPGALAGNTTRVTDADGRAPFTDLRIIGATGPHTLIFAATGFTSVTSDPVEVRQAATTTRITADEPDPSAPNQPVTVKFTVTGEAGTPSGNVTVSASTGETCSATIAAGECTLTLAVPGNQTLTATFGGDGSFAGSSDTEGHRVNVPPTAAGDVVTVAEDQSVTIPVLDNDLDPDGDRLTPVEVSDPAHGTAAVNGNGTITYTPDPDYVGPDAFTYRASDGVAASAPAAVSVTVTPANDPPTAVPDEYSSPPLVPLTVNAPGLLANDTDVDGDPLSISPTSITQPAHGVVVPIVGGGFFYTPIPGFTGDDMFTYRVSDGQVESAPTVVTIHVGLR